MAAPAPSARWRNISLRDYQHAALEAWGLGARQGLVVLPTGAGKTRLALAAIAESRPATLILVPTRVLLRQWRAAVAEFYCEAVGVLGDGDRDLRAVSVATYSSGRRHMPWMGDRFDLIVVDEAHHFGIGELDEALEMCTAPKRLGLTATPATGLQAMRLARVIGPVRFELHAPDLMGTHLAELTLTRWLLDLGSEERREYDRARDVFLAVWRQFVAVSVGAPWQEFVSACRRTTGGREALRAWHRARKIAGWTRTKSDAVDALLARHSDDRVLVFTLDKDSAYTIARDHWIMPITSDISRAEREWALASFRAGDLSALVSARVLNEGVDVPAASVAIIAGAAGGDTEFLQRVGRVLRPQTGKRAIVYELVSSNTTEAGRVSRRSNDLGAGPSRAVRYSC